MKRAVISALAIMAIIIFAGCSDSAKEKMRIEEGKYFGAKFEYQMETKRVYKVIYRAEDVSNLISNFNRFAMEKKDDQIEEWVYRITFVRTLEVSNDRQSLEFSTGKEDLVVLVSENKIQIGDQTFHTSSEHLEVIKSKYESWNHYDENIE